MVLPLAPNCCICETTLMSGPRISAIEFDESSLVRRGVEIEQERRVAMFDLIEDNVFKPLRAYEAGHHGPYKLLMAVHDGRLQLDVYADDGDELLESFVLGMAKFRRPVREYYAICESYNKAVRRASPHEIETIDMARRGVHDRAAEMLLERLDGKVETDFATARRLFTLICVLHIRV